jgi:hypothetical protein
MKYVALKDFNEFKIGDDVPAEFVEQRFIRSKKIGIVYSDSVETKEVSEELIVEFVPETVQEEILLEDSSAVEVITEEVEIVEVPVKETKKSKK